MLDKKTNLVRLFQDIKRLKRYGLAPETDQEMQSLLVPLVKDLPVIQGIYPTSHNNPSNVEFLIQWASWFNRKDKPGHLYLTQHGDFYFSRGSTKSYYRNLISLFNR